MKFTKKMVEVIERQIGRKLTADEIERGAVKETVKTWSSSKVVSIREGWTRNYISKDSLLVIHMYIREQHSMHRIRNLSRQLEHKG